MIKKTNKKNRHFKLVKQENMLGSLNLSMALQIIPKKIKNDLYPQHKKFHISYLLNIYRAGFANNNKIKIMYVPKQKNKVSY